jgi:acyl-CoA thioesterase FadM
MAEWIETFKGVIDAREYDPNAHMNTQAYVSRFDQATWFLLAAVGWTPRTVRERKRRVAVLRQSFNFVHELKGSELIVIKSGFVAVGDKHLIDRHERCIETAGHCARVVIFATGCCLGDVFPMLLEAIRYIDMGIDDDA